MCIEFVQIGGLEGTVLRTFRRRSSRLDATILQHDDVIAVLRHQIHPRHGTRDNGVLNEMLYQYMHNACQYSFDQFILHRSAFLVLAITFY